MNPAYDRIAAIYDADMGASMVLPDLALYRRLALEAGGPVLELGCGTGRVLAALNAAGIPAVGVDRSAAMLAQARRRLGTDVALACMDLRALAFSAAFSAALLPYSLATYLCDPQDWQGLAQGLRRALKPGARVVLDAFVPRDAMLDRGWLRDYARPVDGAWLVRHKRLRRLADGCVCIERRYRLRGHFRGRTMHTIERIRPLTPAQLAAIGERWIGPVEQRHDDYGQHSPDGPRFVTLSLRLR